MRNFVSFEWEIGNREHLTRDFFLFKDATRFTWSHAYFFDHKSPLFLQQEFLNNSDNVSYQLPSVYFSFEKTVCFEFLKYSSNFDWNWKKTVFFLCCSNDVELNMSIVKFEFTRLSAFTMTWQSSFLPWH